MTRPLRTLAAKLFVGAAALSPLALPPAAPAQPNTPASVPEAKRLTAKEQHQRLLKSTGWVQQRAGDQVLSHGTGWVWDAGRKLMVTNDHVVAGQDVVWVVFPKYSGGKLVREASEYAGEKGVKATVVDRDRTRDLAVLQLESLPEGVTALTLAADEPEEGDAVRTIGGFTNGSDNLVFGGVGGEVRTVGTNGGLHGRGKVRVVLSTVSINGGNSGGPLVNEAGELVGVNSYTVQSGPTGRAVSNVNGHIAVTELKAYLGEVDPLVAPKAAKGFVARGERKLKAERYDAAIKDFSAALAKDETDARALYLRGVAFTAAGDPRTALDDLAAAIKRDAAPAEYRLARGRALRGLGKAEEAAADFSAAIRADPTLWEGYNQRGLVAFEGGKPGEAEADFTRAIEKGEGVAVLWANRCEARFAQKRYADAAKDFARAAELEPAHPGYALGLGNSLRMGGQPAKAAAVLSEAAERIGDPKLLTFAGLAYNDAGEYEKAVAATTAALKGFGDRGPRADVGHAYRVRGWAQWKRNNLAEAVADAGKAIDLMGGKDGQAYLVRGMALRESGRAEAAAKDLAAAKRLGQEVPEDAPADPPLVGRWQGTFAADGMRAAMTFHFRRDGSYQGGMTVGDGATAKQSQASGQWTLAGDTLTLRLDDGSTTTLTVKVKGDELRVEAKEFEQPLVFTRAK